MNVPRERVVVTGSPNPIASVWPGLDGRDWGDEGYLDDQRSLELARNGDALTVFQFDGPGMRRLLRDMRASCFEDLVAATTLYRPGPMGAKGDQAYVARKNGDASWRERTPAIVADICRNTYGLPIYQELIMLILNRVGLIPMPDCERVRKAISTKKTKVFAKYRQKFVDRSQETCGWTAEQAQEYWDTTIQGWSSYGFNRSHAVAYTVLSSRGLYLKAWFPLEWYCSVLSHLKAGHEKLRPYMGDAAKRGVVCEPVDVQRSGAKWKISSSETLLFPLSQLKGVGETASTVEAGAPYASLTDFFERSGAGKRAVAPLAAAGALDSLCPNRAAVVELFELWRKRREGRLIGPTSIRAAALAVGAERREAAALVTGLKGFQTASWVAEKIVSSEDPGPSSAWDPPAKTRLDRVVAWLLGKDALVESLWSGGLSWVSEGAIRAADAGDVDGTALASAIVGALEKGGLSPEKLAAVAAELERADAAAELDFVRVADGVTPWSPEETCAKESEALGFASPFSHPLRRTVRVDQRPIAHVDSYGVADGLVVSVEKRKSKRASYRSVTLDDGFDELRVTVWEDAYEQYSDALTPGKCVRVRVDPPGKYASATLKNLPNAVRVLEFTEQDGRPR